MLVMGRKPREPLSLLPQSHRPADAACRKLPSAARVIVCALVLVMCCLHGVRAEEVPTPDIAPVVLKPYAHIDYPALRELSGLVASRTRPGVFWTHNDSGDKPRVFAITRSGQIIKPKKTADYAGVKIAGAKNVDWEDIATDDRGYLLIGDLGNNLNKRKNLVVYVIKEPNPRKSVNCRVIAKIAVRYPKGSENDFAPNVTPNAEALFWTNGSIFILTKQMFGNKTTLYRLDTDRSFSKARMSLVGRFHIQGSVTAADVTPDGRTLVVLTYNAVWLFQTRDDSGDYFGGDVSWLPIRAGQCEAISFAGEDNRSLIIANEDGELFELSVDRLLPVRRHQEPGGG